MKNKTAYIYLICFGIVLMSSTNFAQTGSEIKFKLLNGSLATDKNLVTVSAAINARQSVSGNGIHFTLIVKNTSGNAISIQNIVNELTVSLYNEKGLNISVPNDVSSEVKINRSPKDGQKKLQSESVIVDQVSINGRKESSDFKKQEYIQIPADGNCKVNLILKNVKQVETPQDVQNRILKPTKSLSSGKYKLKLYLSIVSSQQNKSVVGGAIYFSPMIDIDYTR
ncbi:hypothetical protein [Pedobacter frigoris]|uniref:hypothetical protein n=1 Tax=Pedobacter frigoris TaxID=2571272 RepID=UPI00292D8433|nr:hypothetical protein [Pedobacter frigoris]